MLHGTRSGVANNPTEGIGTVNYCTTPGTTSYHWILDTDGTIYELVPAGYAAWHAAELNYNYLGLAFAQGTKDDPITDEQHASARWLIARECKRWGIPPVHLAWLPGVGGWGVTEHMTTAQGVRFGKSDVGYRLSWEALGL